jgi:hypothetical protein
LGVRRSSRLFCNNSLEGFHDARIRHRIAAISESNLHADLVVRPSSSRLLTLPAENTYFYFTLHARALPLHSRVPGFLAFAISTWYAFLRILHFMSPPDGGFSVSLCFRFSRNGGSPNRALQPTAPQGVVELPSNSPAAGTAPGTRCAQNQRQHTARQSRFLLAPVPVFSAAPSGAAAELGR